MKMTWKKARLAEMYSHKMIAFLSQEDRSHKYVIYHTLELQASKHKGVLRYSESRAFTHEELAKMCLTDIVSLENALNECKNYELIKEEEDGTLIFLEELEVEENYTSGGAMSDAERARRYRERKKQRELDAAGNKQVISDESRRDESRDEQRVTMPPREDKIREEKKREFINPLTPPKGGNGRADGEKGDVPETADPMPQQHTTPVTDAPPVAEVPSVPVVPAPTSSATATATPPTSPAQPELGLEFSSSSQNVWEYPLEKIQRGYDEAFLPAAHRDQFCSYIFDKALLENTRKIRNLPAYIKTLYNKWISSDEGPHADAPQITREELAEYVSGVNAPLKPRDRVSPETEEDFWKWLASQMFKNYKGVVISKLNVNGVFSTWWQRYRKNGGGNGGTSIAAHQDLAFSMAYSQDIGTRVKPREGKIFQ